MPEVELLRIEFVESKEPPKSISTISPGMAVGAVGATNLNKFYKSNEPPTLEEFKEKLAASGYTSSDFPDVKVGKGFIGGLREGFGQKQSQIDWLNEAAKKAGYKNDMDKNIYIFRKSYATLAGEASEKSFKNAGKAALKGIGIAVAASNIYSQYKTVGYNLSGATHAAQKQQRIQSGINTVGSIIAAGVVNPALLPVIIAMKAWQLSQTNRAEIYKITSSQIVGNILQERLVTNTIQRRF